MIGVLKTSSDYFFRNIDGSMTSRLDYVFHNPRYDGIKETVKSDNFRDLGSLIVEGSIEYGITESGKETGETAFINIENLETNGRINQVDVIYLDNVSSEMLLKENDILISRSRLVGVCAVASKNDENAAFGSYIIRFKAKTDEIVPLYLAKFVNSELGQAQVDYLQTGSSGNNINTNQIKSIRVLYVEPKSQNSLIKRMTDLEGKADELMLKLEEIREKSNHSLMDELGIEMVPKIAEYFFKSGKDESSPYFFTDFENISNSNRMNFTFYDPKLKFVNRLFDKYSTTSLGDACVSLIRGEQPEYSQEGDVLAIKTINLKNAFIDYENCLRVSHEFYDNYPNAQIQNNDILVSSTGYGSIGKVDVFDKKYRAMADGHLSILRLKEGYDPNFITYFLRSDFGKMQFEKWWTGSSGQIEIQRDDLAGFKIPDNTERGIPLIRQQNIAGRITEILTEIKNLEMERKWYLSKVNEMFEGFIKKEIESHHIAK